MSNIVFLKDKSTIYEGSFEQIGSNQVRIMFESTKPSKKILLSGFNLVNEHNGYVQTVREDYKFIYHSVNNNAAMIKKQPDTYSTWWQNSDIE